MHYRMNRHEVEMLGRQEATRYGNVAKIFNKYQLFVDPEDQSVTPCLLKDGFWEAWITAWFTNNIKPGSAFFDIGAHCGYYTMVASHYVGPNGIVFAFEPNPRLANTLLKSKELNHADNVRVVPSAITDRTGTATLTIPGKLTGSASLYQSFPQYTTEEILVNTETLSNYLRLIKPTTPVMIKIDAEDGEEKALDAAWGMLYTFDDVTIVLEYTPGAYTNGFIPNMREFGDVKLLNTDGREQEISDTALWHAHDWLTLVVRNYKR